LIETMRLTRATTLPEMSAQFWSLAIPSSQQAEAKR
jgi:hypothetical protein